MSNSSEQKRTKLVSSHVPSVAKIDAALKMLLKRYPLDKIEILILRDSYHARAYPAAYHPEVGRRRNAAIVARGGSITLAEADTIQTEALAPVAHVRAPTLEDAVRALEKALLEGPL